MKRQFYWMGRAGAVLLVVGVAVALVSFIPPAGGSTFGGSGSFLPGMMNVLAFPNLITPQQQITFTVEADHPVLVHVLETSESYFREWIMDRFPDLQLDGVIIDGDGLSLTALEAFLDAHPDSLLFTHENRTIHWQFTPSRVMNATAVMANPTDVQVSFDYTVEVSTILAPAEVALPQALFLAASGVFLVLPWTVTTLSTKRTFRVGDRARSPREESCLTESQLMGHSVSCYLG